MHQPRFAGAVIGMCHRPLRASLMPPGLERIYPCLGLALYILQSFKDLSPRARE